MWFSLLHILVVFRRSVVPQLVLSDRRASQRLSPGSSLQVQFPRFRFLPQRGQSPLQSVLAEELQRDGQNECLAHILGKVNDRQVGSHKLDLRGVKLSSVLLVPDIVHPVGGRQRLRQTRRRTGRS